MASTRVEQAVSKVLEAIAAGEFTPGTALPPEDQFAAWLDVSRPTMREAVRILKERGILDVRHGKGTFVVNPDEWQDVAAICWWVQRTASPRRLGNYLIEVRRMVEVSAAGLCAAHRSSEDLAKMEKYLAQYDQAIATHDDQLAVVADLGFHDAIMSGSKNPFLPAMLAPLRDVLRDSRQRTGEFSEVRQRAQRHHQKIFAAIAAGKEQEAKDAMRAHMTQTADDILAFLDDN